MEIKVSNMLLCNNTPAVKAVVSITIDGSFAVNNLRVIQDSNNRLLVAMPDKIDIKGRFHNIIHPITSAARKQLEEVILAEYKIKKSGGKTHE